MGVTAGAAGVAEGAVLCGAVQPAAMAKIPASRRIAMKNDRDIEQTCHTDYLNYSFRIPLSVYIVRVFSGNIQTCFPQHISSFGLYFSSGLQ
jgi:hypothetical protein